jgi:hypothetical protein
VAMDGKLCGPISCLTMFLVSECSLRLPEHTLICLQLERRTVSNLEAPIRSDRSPAIKFSATYVIHSRSDADKIVS